MIRLIGVWFLVFIVAPVTVGLVARQYMPFWNWFLLCFVYGNTAGTWYTQWLILRAQKDAYDPGRWEDMPGHVCLDCGYFHTHEAGCAPWTRGA